MGKRLYQDKATCGFCHGDGAGDPQSPGKAANLRETKLDHEQLVEVIRCGIPGGKAMPHFDKFAWTRNTEWIASITARSGASGVVRILAL